MDSRNYDVYMDYLWRDTRTSGDNSCEGGNKVMIDLHEAKIRRDQEEKNDGS